MLSTMSKTVVTGSRRARQVCDSNPLFPNLTSYRSTKIVCWRSADGGHCPKISASSAEHCVERGRESRRHGTPKDRPSREDIPPLVEHTGDRLDLRSAREGGFIPAGFAVVVHCDISLKRSTMAWSRRTPLLRYHCEGLSSHR